MKIQLIAVASILVLSSSAFAGKSEGSAPTSLTNNSTNALAVGGETLIGAADKHSIGIAYNDGGRAIAGSIFLEGNACACDLGTVMNTSKNAIAVGSATAGSIHVNTMGKSL